MGFLRLVILLALLSLSAVPAGAAVFQYFDEEGTLIVTDNPYHLRRPRTAQDPKYPNISLAYRDDVVYDYYPVAGKNFREAILSANANGPYDSREGKNYAGQTRWNSGWSYKFRSSHRIEGSLVRVSLNIYDIEFGYNISVLLPMLSEGSALNYHDQQLWEGFLKGLLEHEHDHVKIVRDPSLREEAVRKLSGITEINFPYEPHADLDSVIKSAVEAETARAGHDVIMKIKALNDDYDRLTEHGLKPELREVFFRR